jgi:hypothetical protein
VKLFNLILDSGKYPSAWRKSFIIRIHKSGDKSDLNNYRGISLWPINIEFLGGDRAIFRVHVGAFRSLVFHCKVLNMPWYFDRT